MSDGGQIPTYPFAPSVGNPGQPPDAGNVMPNAATPAYPQGYAPQPAYTPQPAYGAPPAYYGQQPAPYYPPAPVYQEPDAPSAGFAVLGFFIPIVGLILWLVWKDNTPLKAKSAGKGALIGFIVSIVLTILIFVAYALFMAAIIRAGS